MSTEQYETGEQFSFFDLVAWRAANRKEKSHFTKFLPSTQTHAVLRENRVRFKCGMHYVDLMTLADLPVGREDLHVLLKKLIRFIHIKVKRESIRICLSIH